MVAVLGIKLAGLESKFNILVRESGVSVTVYGVTPELMLRTDLATEIQQVRADLRELQMSPDTLYPAYSEVLHGVLNRRLRDLVHAMRTYDA